MKKDGLSEKTRLYAVNTVRYGLYAFNLALLFALGVRTLKTWISLPFDFLESLKKYPAEPEFLLSSAPETQFWSGLAFETTVFVIGAFLCYELLIKQKEIRKNLLAPFFIAFMLLSAESFVFFLPALDKAREIDICERMNLSWDAQKHRCNYMDIEKNRLLTARNNKERKK